MLQQLPDVKIAAGPQSDQVVKIQLRLDERPCRRNLHRHHAIRNFGGAG